MVKIIIILILFSISLHTEAEKGKFSIKENWKPQLDKGMHVGIGVVLMSAINVVGGSDISPENKLYFVTAVAASKEVGYDYFMKEGTPSIADFCYTVAPALISYMIDDVDIKVSTDNGVSMEINYEIMSW